MLTYVDVYYMCHMCLLYVSSYYYVSAATDMCVLILLHVCPHASDIYVLILTQVLHRDLKSLNLDSHFISSASKAPSPQF